MIQIDVEITCDTCGNGLEITGEDIKHETIKVIVKPCENCQDDEYRRGRQEEAEQQ